MASSRLEKYSKCYILKVYIPQVNILKVLAMSDTHCLCPWTVAICSSKGMMKWK